MAGDVVGNSSAWNMPYITFSIRNLCSLSISMVSNRYSRRSWIIWIKASHCIIINCSNSWHDSLTEMKWKKKSFAQIKLNAHNYCSDFLNLIEKQRDIKSLSVSNMMATKYMRKKQHQFTVTLSLIPLSRWMNSVVERAFSDNCCRLCDSSVWMNVKITSGLFQVLNYLSASNTSAYRFGIK